MTHGSEDDRSTPVPERVFVGRGPERDTTVLWGRAWEGEGAPPYWPWTQILRVLLQDRDGAELKAIFGAATPYLAQIVPEIAVIHRRLCRAGVVY